VAQCKQREPWASTPRVTCYYQHLFCRPHFIIAMEARGPPSSLQHRWWPLPDLLPAALGGPPSMSPASVVTTAGPATSTPRGLVVDVFNIGGDRCRKSRQQYPGAPPSMSSTSVVAAAGPAASSPRGPAINVSNFGGRCCRTCCQHPLGGRHRRLQLRWWPLPDLPPAPPRGPPSASSTLVVAAARPADSTPQGARYRRLQLR
jgi:hypothetical protein